MFKICKVSNFLILISILNSINGSTNMYEYLTSNYIMLLYFPMINYLAASITD